MVRGLYTAASGMLTQEMRLEVTTNNLANAATQGYRPDRAVVSDFRALYLNRLYDPERVPFDDDLEFDPMPKIGYLGAGSYVSEIHTDFDAEGPISATSRPLDLAINGRGFFAVQTETGVRYTREGTYMRDLNDFVVDEDGNQLLGLNGPIQLPAGAPTEEVSVGWDGTVEANGQVVDRLQVVETLPGAQTVGYNLVDAIGGVQPVGPETRVQQGAVEMSPVEVVREMVGLIEVQRAYEANQKVVQAEDQSLEQLLQKVAG